MEILTIEHPRWTEFAKLLQATIESDGCNAVHYDRPHATNLLETIGGIDVPATLRYFDAHGGYCDCEILLNVDRRQWSSREPIESVQ